MSLVNRSYLSEVAGLRVFADFRQPKYIRKRHRVTNHSNEVVAAATQLQYLFLATPAGFMAAAFYTTSLASPQLA